MNARARAVHYRHDNSPQHRTVAARAVLAISGSLFSLFGAALALGGLLSLDGSAFSILSGFGLILSGALVARRHRAGAWAFLAVFVTTVFWALRNVELGGTSLAMRLVGPSILLLMIALLMPALRGWRVRQTLLVFATLMAGTIGLAVSSTTGGPLAQSTAAAAQLLDAHIDGVVQ